MNIQYYTSNNSDTIQTRNDKSLVDFNQGGMIYPLTNEMNFPENELSSLSYNETSWKHNNILSGNNEDLTPSHESHQIPNQNLAFFQDAMERLDYNIEDNNLFTTETEAVRSFL